MSTLQMHAPRLPKLKLVSLRPVLARIAAVLKTTYEVFTEAQIQAHEARQRYPYLNGR